MTGRGLTEAACHFGGVGRGSTVTRTCRATWRNRPRPAATTAEPGRSYNRDFREISRRRDGAARLVVATKRSNVRGAKEPCCTDVGVKKGRQGWIDKPAQHAAGPETTTVRHGEGCVGLITLDVNGAGARSVVNPHAACDAAGAGDGITATSKRARRGKPRNSQGAAYGLPRQFPTLPAVLKGAKPGLAKRVP